MEPCQSVTTVRDICVGCFCFFMVIHLDLRMERADEMPIWRPPLDDWEEDCVRNDVRSKLSVIATKEHRQISQPLSFACG